MNLFKDSCEQRNDCIRCGTKGKRTGSHEWGEWLKVDITWDGEGPLFRHYRECCCCKKSESYDDECDHSGSGSYQICTICGTQLDMNINA